MNIKELTEKNSFCILPFIHQEKKFNGTYHICCYGDQLQSDIEEDSLASFNSSKMQKIRSDMMQGIQPAACSSCFSQEKLGIYSPRQRENETWANWHSTHDAISSCFDNYNQNKEMHPISYDLRYSNTCTLKCRMCNSSSSSAINSEYQKIHYLWPEKFWTIKNPRINHKVDLHSDIQKIYLAGGEPLVEPLNLEFLNNLADFNDQTVILINTSLNHLSDRFYETLNRFKFLTLVVSIDGTHKVNDYIRHGSNFQTVFDNIKKFSNHDMMFSTCVNMYNIFNLIDLIEFISQEFPSKKSNHGISLVNDIEELYVENLPLELRPALIQKLQNITEKLDPQPLNGVMNLINVLEQDNFSLTKFNNFKKYTKILDSQRNESVLNIVPEYTVYFNE